MHNPFARQLIKQLVKDGRFDYIETGSLISLHKNVKDILIPSEEEQLEMFPMDFEEFLWALGDNATVPFLKTVLKKGFDPNIGLSMSRDNTTQKCYMGDTGLLVTQTFRDNEYTDNLLYKSVLLDKLNVNEGMLMENIVAQMLRCNGHHLFFYSRIDSANRSNNMEIDFLISDNKKISPVEVKSSAYRKHSSLDKFYSRFKNKLGERYVLYPKDVMIKDGVVHLLLYMAMFL